MLISRIVLKDFRCFDHLELSLESSPLILLQGANGSGKTSILEALYYVCYLRSFRTYGPQELVRFGRDLFFIDLCLEDNQIEHKLSVGFTHKKRSVRIDERAIVQHKELFDHVRIIKVCEDDLVIIKGSPEDRRVFIDQAILLHNAAYAQILRAHRQKLLHKNALLYKRNVTRELYAIWTDQLLAQSALIRQQRIAYIQTLQDIVNGLMAQFMNYGAELEISYQIKHATEAVNAQELHEKMPYMYEQECAMGRSLYGAHLDDISFHFSQKSARLFASRGQQKLGVLLLKIAQLIYLKQDRGSAIFLLDDFMTDFDPYIASQLLELLRSLSTQLIFTSPVIPGSQGQLEGFLLNCGAHIINISR